MKKKIIFRWIKAVLLIYGIAGIALFYLQDAILFHPSPIARHEKYDFMDQHCREITIPYDRETSLNIVQFNPPSDSTPKAVVLYFHGNRKNIGWYAKYAANFTKNGFAVWMIDYPGYGKSTGKFTEQRLYDFALQLYKLARTRYQPANIIIYGKSLGTCIASQLASIRDCRYLILETPCYSMDALVAHYFPIYPVNRMLHYHFPVYEYIQKADAPVIIFHGTDDGVIPYSQARRLVPLLKKSDAFITIPGAGHNNLNDFTFFHRQLDSLLTR
jgi:uncharacterized protein